jgi:hypothetical protein
MLEVEIDPLKVFKWTVSRNFFSSASKIPFSYKESATMLFPTGRGYPDQPIKHLISFLRFTAFEEFQVRHIT